MSTYPWGYESDISRAGVGDATSLRGRTIDLTQPANDDVLQFNSANNTWENKSVGEILTISGASDNQVMRFDVSTGFIQSSQIVISDTGSISGVNNITATNNINIIDSAGTNMINLQHGGLSALTTNSTVINTFKPIVQNDPTNATGVGTGALQIAGGASVALDLHVGDELFCSSLNVDTNKLTIDSAGNDTTLSTQAQNLLLTVPSAGGRFVDIQNNGVSKFKVENALTTSVNRLNITNNTASTSKTVGALTVTGGIGCNATINTAGLSFDNNASILTTYSLSNTTVNAWKYATVANNFAYNYGTIVPISIIKMGNVRTIHFRVPSSIGNGGLWDIRLTGPGAGGGVLFAAADRPLTNTYGTIYLKHNGTDGIGYCYAGTDGWIYLFPQVPWVANLTNEVFTSTLTWTVSV